MIFTSSGRNARGSVGKTDVVVRKNSTGCGSNRVCIFSRQAYGSSDSSAAERRFHWYTPYGIGLVYMARDGEILILQVQNIVSCGNEQPKLSQFCRVRSACSSAVGRLHCEA